MTLHTIKLHAINISLSRMILSYNSQLGIPSALASIHRKCHNAFFLIVCTKNKSKTLPSLVIYMFLNQITAKHNAADTCIDPAPFLGLFRASRGNLTLTYHMWAHPSVESIDSENISLPYLKHCQMEKNITITTHPIQRAGRKSVRKVKNGLAGEESARLMQTSCKCIPRFTTQT